MRQAAPGAARALVEVAVVGVGTREHPRRMTAEHCCCCFLFFWFLPRLGSFTPHIVATSNVVRFTFQ